MKVSDISLAAAVARGDEKIVLHAFDRGINYFDSACD